MTLICWYVSVCYIVRTVIVGNRDGRYLNTQTELCCYQHAFLSIMDQASEVINYIHKINEMEIWPIRYLKHRLVLIFLCVCFAFKSIFDS